MKISIARLTSIGFTVLVSSIVVAVGCEKTDYQPLYTKEKLKELDEKIQQLESEVAELKKKNSAATNLSPSTTVPSEPQLQFPSTERAESISDSASPVAATPESEAELRQLFEQSDGFFTLNDAGLVKELDLTDARLTSAELDRIVEFSQLEKLVLNGSKTDAATYSMISQLANLQRLEIERSTPTVADLEKLKGLKNLKYLQLFRATFRMMK